MTLDERSNLVLAFVEVLYTNGQSTEQTLSSAERFGNALGIRARIIPRWGELQIHAQDGGASLFMSVEAAPTNVHMSRVSSAMHLLEDLSAGYLSSVAAAKSIETIAVAPPASLALFAIASGIGAVALAVIFGLQHILSAVLIFVSAGVGAVLRRGLAQVSANVFLQPFCAALVAGVVGGLAVRLQLSSTLRLVAVCPCMILVPGPHVLNGALDLIRSRVHLGAARLIYAGLVVVAISTGLLLGLTLLGVSLPVDAPARSIAVWFDALAAGFAVAAYGVFFSTPLQMLPWPVAVGILAHGLRWWTIVVLHSSAATGAFVACLAVGMILTPVAHRHHMPFTAVGFAAVVSLIPGVFLFRMASGLVQLTNGSHLSLEVLSATIADGTTAAGILLAMAFGLLISKLAIDRLMKISTDTISRTSR